MFSDIKKQINELTKEAFLDGMNLAWECARKICSMDYETRREALNVDYNHDLLGKILNTFSASEAIQKVKEYEEKQKADDIKVGDEVVDEYGVKYVVVTDEPTNDGCVSLLSKYYQTTQLYPIKQLRKTGRYFNQIADFIKQLKEGRG